MTLLFKVETPDNFTQEEKNDFVVLLIKQGQVANPNIHKVNASDYICLVYANEKPIGIGAIKNVYNRPFDYADVPDLKQTYKKELGYLYVDNTQINFRGLGIGKTITKLLLSKIGNDNIFATTDEDDNNVMKGILKGLGFKKVGKTYEGQETKKNIGLYIKQGD